MDFLNDIFKKLNTTSSEAVGIYISADSTMEVVVYDADLKEVLNYEKVSIQYNHVLREVDLEELEKTLIPLLNKMNISSTISICFSLPNVLTSIKSFPSNLEDIELDVALVSEAEKSYVFKKTEPKASWSFLSENKESLNSAYLYSIIQKEHAENIQQLFKRNNFKLIAIDTSFTCLLRGLSACGLISNNLEKNLKWCVVTIAANNYVIAKFQGENLLNIIETPLALRSIETDVLYPTIARVVSEKLEHENLDNIYMVSQTENFLTSELANHIKIICNLYNIDNNKYKDKPLFFNLYNNEKDPKAISPESIGAACWNKSDIDINFNFTDIDTSKELTGVFGKLGVRTPLHLYLLIGIVISFISILLGSFFIAGINNQIKESIAGQATEIAKLEKLNVAPPKEFDINDVVYSSYKKNENLLDFYDSIGAGIPEKLWLAAFFVDGNLNTTIKGEAYKIEDIVSYFENLEKISKFKDLKIKKIEVKSDSNNMNNFNADNSERDLEMQDPFGNNDLPLPLPPKPNQLDLLKDKSYYEFIFERKQSNNNETEASIINNLPDFAKNIIFGK